jgi:hypothetical protein
MDIYIYQAIALLAFTGLVHVGFSAYLLYKIAKLQENFLLHISSTEDKK